MNHKGLQVCLERLEGLFYASTTNTYFPRTLAVLYEQEPNLLELLAELVAVTAYQEFFPAMFPNEAFYRRMLAHALIKKVFPFSLAKIPKNEKKYKIVDGWVKARIGKELFEMLYPFLRNLALKIVDEGEQKRVNKQLEEPLE